MPIGGAIISIRPQERDIALAGLKDFSEVEVHGVDEQGNVVVVLDTPTSVDMEMVIKSLHKQPWVLHVSLTYLNVEDEAEKIAGGDYAPAVFGSRKHEKERQ